MTTELVFTFHSTHQAIKGEQSLVNGGLKVRVMALPNSLGAGCGLCLRVAPDEVTTALALLQDVGIEPEGVYSKVMEEGRAVYLPLGRE